MTWKVYFSHPVSMREEGKHVSDMLRKSGFDVYNPLDYEVDNHWQTAPSSKLAVEIWMRDFRAVRDSDVLFAWLPLESFARGVSDTPPHVPIGTQMEIYAAFMKDPSRVYIVTDVFHPFLAATTRCFPTIGAALGAMRRDLEK